MSQTETDGPLYRRWWKVRLFSASPILRKKPAPPLLFLRCIIWQIPPYLIAEQR